MLTCLGDLGTPLSDSLYADCDEGPKDCPDVAYLKCARKNLKCKDGLPEVDPECAGCDDPEDSVPTGREVPHSSDQVPPKVPDKPETEIAARGAHHTTADKVGPQALVSMLTGPICAGTTQPAGQVFAMHLVTAGPIPGADDTYLYEYGFVLDLDGQPGNNWVAASAYPNDFFQDTDRWYVVGYKPGTGWSLAVTDVLSDGTTAGVNNSSACAQIDGSRIDLVIPAGELDPNVYLPAYRVTAFAHTGDYGLQPPYDWSGDVEPPVAEGLALPTIY